MTSRVDIVGAEIARPVDKALCARVGVDQTRVDRVDQCQVYTLLVYVMAEVSLPVGIRWIVHNLVRLKPNKAAKIGGV